MQIYIVRGTFKHISCFAHQSSCRLVMSTGLFHASNKRVVFHSCALYHRVKRCLQFCMLSIAKSRRLRLSRVLLSRNAYHAMPACI